MSNKFKIDGDLSKPLIENLPIGLLLLNKKNNRIEYTNVACEYFIRTDKKAEKDILEFIINGKQNNYVKHIGDRVLSVTRIEIESDTYRWFMVEDLTDFSKNKKLSDKAKELNKEYMNIFGEYGDENIMITDGNGKIIFVGEKIYKTCSVTKEYLVGKSVFEVEKEKIFYPSVTGEVIKKGESCVLLQKTRNNEELVTFGTPIFGKNGKLEKIVSVTKDFSKQIKISSLISELEDGKTAETDKTKLAFQNMVSCDEKVFQIKQLVKLVAPTKSTVLICGETGTGKEVVANAIYKLSTRKDKPYIKVNCGAISHTLIESELFGYEKGAFTGAKEGGKIGLIEAANTGTLFLDEIGELPLDQQVKLLHVIQNKVLTRVGGTQVIPLDIRVIAATNRDLEEEVRLGNFREDLFYRLNVVPITLPPLRSRRQDIVLLSKLFLERTNKSYMKNKRISSDVFEKMQNYNWPGNIRELENMIERLVVTTESDLITIDVLPNDFFKDNNSGCDLKDSDDIIPLNDVIKTTEKKVIKKALDRNKTITEAARELGINQSTLSRKIVALGLKEKK